MTLHESTVMELAQDTDPQNSGTLIQPASQWKGRIPSLDGIRALSFLLVFMAHMGFMDAKPGGFAVSVFFVISGYLITTLLLKEYGKTGSISLRSFYYRRTLRIFPSMYAVLIVCAILASLGLLQTPLNLKAGIFEIFYLENYAFWWNLAAGHHSFYIEGTGNFWSLCVEEHFYLIFPLLLSFLLSKRLTMKRITQVLLAMCGGALLWRLIAVHVLPLGEEYCYVATDCRLDSILWGCLLSTLEHNEEWRSQLTLRRLRWILPFALALLAFTFAFSQTGRMTFRFTLQSIALLPVIYFVTHFPRSLLARPLNHPVLVHLGTLSYALYLIHGAIIQMVLKFVHAPRPVLWVIAAAAVYLAGMVIHLGIERPFLRVRSRHTTSQDSRDRPPLLQISRSS